jgi:hypothetical protein
VIKNAIKGVCRSSNFLRYFDFLKTQLSLFSIHGGKTERVNMKMGPVINSCSIYREFWERKSRFITVEPYKIKSDRINPKGAITYITVNITPFLKKSILPNFSGFTLPISAPKNRGNPDNMAKKSEVFSLNCIKFAQNSYL